MDIQNTLIIDNKVQLYSTRNYTQCLQMIYGGKESEKVYIYIYIYIWRKSQSASRSVVSNSLRPHGL